MLVEMKVEGLLFDPRSNMYILLLKEVDGAGTPRYGSVSLSGFHCIGPWKGGNSAAADP